MAAQWHYRRDGEESVGPVGAEEIKALVRGGELAATDIVWREDMADWVAVGRIKGLKELVPQAAAAAEAPRPVPVRSAPPRAAAPAAGTPASSRPAAAMPVAAVAAVAVPAASPPPSVGTPSVPPPGPSGLFELGDAFQVAGKRFFGEAMASDDAVYLILRRRRNPWSRRGFHVGLVEWAIAGVVQSLSDASVTGVPVVKAGDLPPAIRDHPDWPADGLSPATGVVVFTKAAIGGRGIFHPSMGRLLKFRVGPQRVVIEHALLKGDATRSFLEKAGWPVTWGGKPPPDPSAIAAAGPAGTGGRRKRLVAAAAVAAVAALAVGVWVVVKPSGPPSPPPPTLAQAIESSNLESVRAALAADRNAMTPAAWKRAIEVGDAAVVRALLEAGTPVNPTDGNALPLHVALEHRRPAVVALLIDRGADVDALDADGVSTLRRALAARDPAVVKLILSRRSPQTQDHAPGTTVWGAALDLYSEPLVRTMVERGIDPNDPIPNQGKLIHVAAYRGWVECVRLLLARGVPADDFETVQFKTPLMHAAMSPNPGSDEVVRMLLAAGADPLRTGAQGQSALDIVKARSTVDGPHVKRTVELLTAAAAARKK